jgi:hypothetical protein
MELRTLSEGVKKCPTEYCGAGREADEQDAALRCFAEIESKFK